MAEAKADVIGDIDLTDDEYHVVGGIVRRKWRVHDTDGNLLLRAKQKLFRAKEEFPFVDADGDPVFRVKAEGVLDVSGDYVLYDESDDEPIAVLNKKFTLLQRVWRINSPDGDEWAVIQSRGKLVQLLRGLVRIFALLPYKYTIETPDGEPMGEIAGKFALKDKYDVTIDDSGDVPKEALVACAIAVDALEG